MSRSVPIVHTTHTERNKKKKRKTNQRTETCGGMCLEYVCSLYVATYASSRLQRYTYSQQLNGWYHFGGSQLQQSVDDMGRHSVYLSRAKPTQPELSNIQYSTVDTDSLGREVTPTNKKAYISAAIGLLLGRDSAHNTHRLGQR